MIESWHCRPQVARIGRHLQIAARRIGLDSRRVAQSHAILRTERTLRLFVLVLALVCITAILIVLEVGFGLFDQLIKRRGASSIVPESR